ncbi:MAG: fluoride efflux transporter CrcB [Saprospiraceae bacterium]
MDIRLLMLVGTGSFLGGILRYSMSQWIEQKFPTAFPYGTFMINIIGCLLIGVMFGFAEKNNVLPEWKLFLATGLLGGFTTFSAFSNESISLIREGQTGIAIAYIVASVLVGLLATALGFYFVKAL